MKRPAFTGNEIAVVGMAARLPGAADLETFWHNLRSGVESVTFFRREELLAAGIPPHAVDAPDYVPAKAVIEGVEELDAAFFGIGPRIAEVMDPQQRLFLELAWQALEDAGYVPERVRGPVGVFAGCGTNTYFLHNVVPNQQRVAELGEFQITVVNDKDFVATQVAYHLDLQGPAVAVQTACSTGLVAVHMGCQSLLNGECDAILAGAASVKFPLTVGHVHREGGILSPDGHCRPFDSRAAGTVNGAGAAVIMLKRLDDARADGDTIRAVLLGSAINNDGSRKAGFTAPSPDGQARVVAEALAVAEVDPDTVTYVEAHGTGTAIGDPIEVAALGQAFRAAGRGDAETAPICGLGSVKSNLGHLDAAAGMAGLIKTVLALQHRQIPPTLHFREPNPRLDLESGPFRVVDRLEDWDAIDGLPRRAGVSSFGLGGTNAHVVLEEAPVPPDPVPPVRPEQLLVLSARTAEALEEATRRLARHLEHRPEQALADVAWTLQAGRRGFRHRRTLVARDPEAARSALAEASALATGVAADDRRPVAFLFPGQGAQRVGLGRRLYEGDEGFRRRVDRSCDLLRKDLDLDLRSVLWPAAGEEDEAAAALRRTALAQPALFVLQHAIAALLVERGVEPRALLGHSLGEYVAACVAGTFDEEDALRLVALRGRWMEACPPGAMLAVALSEEALVPRLSGRDGLALAAINGPGRCVVSGTQAAVEALRGDLVAEGVAVRPMDTSHGFHSPAMEGAAEPLGEALEELELRPPRIPWLSNLTGTWITDEEAVSPAYWMRQMTAPVRFSAAARELLAEDRVVLEVGPAELGGALRGVAREVGVDLSLAPGLSGKAEPESMLELVADAWRLGGDVDWEALHGGASGRRRLPLPTYPFERRRYWLDAPVEAPAEGDADAEAPPVVRSVSAEGPPTDAVPRDGFEPGSPEAGHGRDGERRERILTGLRELVSDLIGLPVEEIDIHRSFLEVGVDSLLLIQASQAIERRFDVKLSLAELLEQHSTVAAVADRLDRVMPPEAPPAVRSEPEPPPASGAGPETGGSALERVIQRQLDMMQQQLDLLRRGEPAERLEAEVREGEGGAAPAPPVQPAAGSAQEDGSVHPFAAPPVLVESRALDERRRRHVESLVDRYTARTPESKRRTQEHRPHLAENRASVGFRRQWKEMIYPLIGERSAGSRLWDVDGNEYVDIAMGFGVNLFGHSPDFVTAALREQLDKGVQVGPQSDLAGDVARRVSRLTGMERATFTNSGTEAVMTALRLARAVTGRRRVALFLGAYHGSFDGTLVRRFGDDPSPLPMAPGVPPGMVEDLLVLEYGKASALEQVERHGDELAAVLVEPVQSRRPDLQPREFLHHLRERTAASGTALIFDEVISGFRPHPGGAQAVFGVRADLATYGKVVGGGMPIGVVTGSSRFMDAIDGGAWRFGDDSHPRVDKTFFAGTFCKHPLAMAAARAVLARMEEEGPALQERLAGRTAELCRRLDALFREAGAPVSTVRFASLFRFVFEREAEYADLFFHHLVLRGVYTWEGRTCFLSTAHTEADLEQVLEAVEGSLAELQEGGFLLPGGGTGGHGVRELPLNEVQRGIHTLMALDPAAGAAFNESIGVRFQGPLDVPALRRALQRVVDRHEALRTTFPAGGDLQVVHPVLPVDIPLFDLTALPAADRRRVEGEWLSGPLPRSFDFQRGPLLRARLARLEPEHHLLELTVHHLVTDGWSLGLLLGELRRLYDGEHRGVAVELPEVDRLSDHLERTAGGPASGDRSRNEAYWRRQLGAPPPRFPLPTDHERPAVRSYRGRRLTQPLSADLVETVGRLARDYRCTRFMVLLAAFQLLGHHLTGCDELAVAIALAAQPSAGEENLMGCFLDVVPLVSRLQGDPTFPRHLAELKERVLEAQQHQGCDFAALGRELEPRRDPGRNPLYDVAFHHERTSHWRGPGGLEATAMANPNPASRLDASWLVLESPGELTVHCTYSTDLFDEDRVEDWVASYDRLLQALGQDPERSFSDLSELLRRAGEERREQRQRTRKANNLARLTSVRKRARSGRKESDR